MERIKNKNKIYGVFLCLWFMSCLISPSIAQGDEVKYFEHRGDINEPIAGRSPRPIFGKKMEIRGNDLSKLGGYWVVQYETGKIISADFILKDRIYDGGTRLPTPEEKIMIECPESANECLALPDGFTGFPTFHYGISFIMDKYEFDSNERLILHVTNPNQKKNPNQIPVYPDHSLCKYFYDNEQDNLQWTATTECFDAGGKFREKNVSTYKDESIIETLSYDEAGNLINH